MLAHFAVGLVILGAADVGLRLWGKLHSGGHPGMNAEAGYIWQEITILKTEMVMEDTIMIGRKETCKSRAWCIVSNGCKIRIYRFRMYSGTLMATPDVWLLSL